MNRLFFLAALMVFAAALPAYAQQNIADVIYPRGEPRNEMLGSAVPTEQNRSHVSAIQQELKARGYKIKVDGSFGPKTRAALKKFQKTQGLAQSGMPDEPTLGALGITQLY